MHSQRSSSRSAFTLIELLVVIAIIAILSVVVILSLNPAELLRQSRDSTRLSDMDTMNHALSLYAADQGGSTGFSLGSSSVVYVSIPDTTSTCANLGLPILPSGYTYACVGSTSSKNINGTGWIPVNLSNISSGSPLGSLPLDPINQSSSRLYYTYTTNGSQYELTSALESQKYGLGGSNDVISTDGGTLATVYEKGSKLGLEPLDYGDASLVGLWTFDEGTGTVAYDYSGNNASGTWRGTGTHWAAGKIGAGAGQFATTTADSITATSTALNISGPITISMWVNTNFIPTSNQQFLASNNNSYQFYILSSGALYGDLLTGSDNALTTLPISTGQWYNVALVGNGSIGNMYIYLNGAAINSRASVSPKTGAVNVSMGEASFSGLIDDVRIYNRALTASQIAALYKGGK